MTLLNGKVKSNLFICYVATRDPPFFHVKHLVLFLCSVLYISFKHAEAATRSVLLKKVFLEISQNSQENTFAKFLRTPF